ncbi:MAG: hypothetical protein OIF57_14375 [Marinobacterium sp.]|nr:hypothetical protein [Marinobacterium sp.]
MKPVSLSGITHIHNVTRVSKPEKASPTDEGITQIQRSGYSWSGQSLNMSTPDNAVSGATLHRVDIFGPDPDNMGEAYGKAKEAQDHLLLYQDLLLSGKISKDLKLSSGEPFSLANALDEYRLGGPLPMANSNSIHPASDMIRSWLDSHPDQVSVVSGFFDLSNSAFASLESFQQHYGIKDGEEGVRQIQMITENLTSLLDRAKLEWRAEIEYSQKSA